MTSRHRARALRNFVGGEHVDPADGRTADVVDPSHRQGLRAGPGLLGRRTSTARCRPRPRRFETLARRDPQRPAEGAASGSPTRSRRAPRSSSTPRSRNTGKPRGLTMSEEIAADGRPDPLLRRGSPGARGPLRRGVHGRPHLVRPPRADRRLRPGDARGTTR